MKIKKIKKQNFMPVCYKQSSTNIIEWGNAVKVEKCGQKAIVRFEDGSWNSADLCFFTEKQCRVYHDLPTKDWMSTNLVVIKKLEQILAIMKINE